MKTKTYLPVLLTLLVLAGTLALASTHQWGTLVELTRIEKMG